MSSLREAGIKFGVTVVFGAAAIGILAGVMALTGQDPQADARNALEASGFSEITTKSSTSALLLKCGDDDNFAYEFTAKNPVGKSVHGYVCSGFTKGATIRF